MNTPIKTERLTLRQWREEDFQPFYDINSDKTTMQYFPMLLSRAESDEIAEKCHALIAQRGWGFWAVSLKESDDFMGFVGLHIPSIKLPFSPCVEIGWRLNKHYWGKGYATEAALASLGFAFEELKLDEVVSFTAVVNAPSRAVMERIGMINTGNNFMHPSVPPGHELAEHVLYKINRVRWFNREQLNH